MIPIALAKAHYAPRKCYPQVTLDTISGQLRMATKIEGGELFSQREDGNQCLCLAGDPKWVKERRILNQSEAEMDEKPAYSDADLANDLNHLTFEERQAIFEEIHGVSDVIPETPEFLANKVHELFQVLENLSASVVKRTAWDRAVFYRPSLLSDTEHALLFLRARRFEAHDTAHLILQYYERRYLLWENTPLVFVRRVIKWDDLSNLEQTIVRSGFSLNLPRNRESSALTISYTNASLWPPEWSAFSVLRALSYRFYWNFEMNSDLQRRGRVDILDVRGKTQGPRWQQIQNARAIMPFVEASPSRSTAVHVLLSSSARAFLVGNLQSLMPRNSRVRVRAHIGTWMEIQYSLRSYGIDIPYDCLESKTTDAHDMANPFSQASIDQTIRKWLNMEKHAHNQLGIAGQDPASPTALYPNPQDVLLGKNRRFAATWPGTLAYNRIIQQHAQAYLATHIKTEKTKIAHIVLEGLKRDYKARLLTRREAYWEAVSDADARLKISQSLRDEARKLSNEMRMILT